MTEVTAPQCRAECSESVFARGPIPVRVLVPLWEFNQRSTMLAETCYRRTSTLPVFVVESFVPDALQGLTLPSILTSLRASSCK